MELSAFLYHLAVIEHPWVPGVHGGCGRQISWGLALSALKLVVWLGPRSLMGWGMELRHVTAPHGASVSHSVRWVIG